jgi:hypothetical protein
VGSSLVTISAADWERLRDLQRRFDLDVFGPTARQLPDGSYAIDGLVTDEQLDEVRSAGYQVTITADADRLARDRQAEAGGENPS